MRYLIRNFDLDDVRWLVLVVLAVSLFTSWDHTRALEQRMAAIETSAARAREPEPEPIELRDDEEDRLPTATEWGNGSMCVDADYTITTVPAVATVPVGRWPVVYQGFMNETSEVKPWQRELGEIQQKLSR